VPYLSTALAVPCSLSSLTSMQFSRFTRFAGLSARAGRSLIIAQSRAPSIGRDDRSSRQKKDQT
jgi:hypothetical protein